MAETRHQIKVGSQASLLKLIVGGGFITGAFFASLGVWLVYLASTGDSQVSFFGQSLKTDSAGVAALFFGSMTVILIIRPTLSLISKTNSDESIANQHDTLKLDNTSTVRDYNSIIRDLSMNQKALLGYIIIRYDMSDQKTIKAFFKGTKRELGDRSDGVYVDRIAKEFGMERDQVVYRCRELASQGLIDILPFTDLCCRPSENLLKYANSNMKRVLESLYTRKQSSGN